MFQNAVNIEVAVFSKRGAYNKPISSSIYMYLQTTINISFHVVLTFVFKLLFTSCYKLIHVVFVLPFVYKLLHVVSTSCYNVLQVHVSTRLEIMFGNDVALHKALHKKGLEIYIIYY